MLVMGDEAYKGDEINGRGSAREDRRFCCASTETAPMNFSQIRSWIPWGVQLDIDQAIELIYRSIRANQTITHVILETIATYIGLCS